jgi:hypothetical protein
MLARFIMSMDATAADGGTAMCLHVGSLRMLEDCGYGSPLERKSVLPTTMVCWLDRKFAGVGSPEGYSTLRIYLACQRSEGIDGQGRCLTFRWLMRKRLVGAIF